MRFFTVQNIRALLFPRRRLNCPHRLWTQLSRELHERGRGSRESGAFLLGRRDGQASSVKSYLLYDDIDPNCLTGGILFDGSHMDLVWKECRDRQLEVVADVHTHPGGYGQSGIDRANPMIPEPGHIALIIPNFANRIFKPGEIGIYEFRGRGHWIDHSRLGRRFFQVGSLA
jgi:proteasome lid subunit RPN8/RPN11